MKPSFFTRSAIALALAAILPTMAGAQENAVDEDVIELEDAYVRPDYVEIERLRNTKEIIVLDKEVIQEKGNRTVSDILADTPSVSVNAAGHGIIDIRGMGTGQAQRNVQVFMDGMPITPLTNHPFQSDFNVIPVEDVERIEIIPGGGSVLYGAGTAGGVVNITSNMKNLDETKQSVNAEWNSEGYRLNASVGAKLNDKFSLQVSASKLDRDLYFVDSWKDSEYYSAGLRWNLTKDQTIIVRSSFLREDSELFQSIKAEDVKQYGKYAPVKAPWASVYQMTKLKADREQKQYSVSYINDISDNIHWTNDIYYGEGWITGNNLDQQMDNKGHGYRTTLEFGYGEDSSLLIGFNYAKQDADLCYDDWNGPQHFLYDRKSYALFATNTIKVNNWEFIQGVRRERNTWKFDKSLKKKAFQDKRETDNNAVELAAAYRYSDSGKVYARYERGFTLPDGVFVSDERVENGVSGLYATKADDEIFNMYEIGFSDKIGFTTVNLTLWLSQTDDQLDRVEWTEGRWPNNKKYRVTGNFVDTKRTGVDLNLMQEFGKLTLQESYSYLRGRSKYVSQEAQDFIENKFHSDMEFTGGGLQAVPEHKVSLKADYAFMDNLTAGLAYTWTGDYKNFTKQKNAGEGGTVDAYGVLDFSFKFQPRQWMTIYGGVNNVLDEEYFDWGMDQAGGTGSQMIVPGQERSFYIGLKATY